MDQTISQLSSYRLDRIGFRFLWWLIGGSDADIIKKDYRNVNLWKIQSECDVIGKINCLQKGH